MGKQYVVSRCPAYRVERDRHGRFKKWKFIPSSIRADEAKKAKKKKPRSQPGYGHRVDYPKD